MSCAANMNSAANLSGASETKADMKVGVRAGMHGAKSI